MPEVCDLKDGVQVGVRVGHVRARKRDSGETVALLALVHLPRQAR